MMLTGLMAFAGPLSAANSIILNDEEKSRISRGETVVRDVQTVKKSGKTVEAIGMINASRAVILKVLTDFESYPDFMPNVSRTEIKDQNSTRSFVNFTLSLPMEQVKKYRLEFTRTDPNKSVSTLNWQMTPWPGLKAEKTIKDCSGYWWIVEKGQNRSLVLYHVYTDPGPVPLGLGWIVDYMTRKSVPQVLSKTRSRAEQVRLP